MLYFLLLSICIPVRPHRDSIRTWHKVNVMAAWTSQRQVDGCLEDRIILEEEIVQHVGCSGGEGRSGGQSGRHRPEHMAVIVNKHQCLAAEVPQHRPERL
jgi:hypothetical protein